MRQVKLSFMLLIVSLAMVLSTSLAGCYGGYGGGYYDEGPEWDGTVFVGGGYGGGYYRDGGRQPEGAISGRGRASMGGHGGGGGGGHAGSGGGGGGHR